MLRYGQTRTDREDGTTQVDGNCFVTREPHSVVVDTKGLDLWLTGSPYIQSALPDATLAEREFLMSGTSPKGWALMFPAEENAGDD